MYTRNLTMLTDFYEITMANGYLNQGMKDTIVYFDMFFRKIPDQGGFAIMSGLQPLIDYLSNLHFSEKDIEFLRNKNMFCEEFLDYLRNFNFECDLWSVPEGTPIFPDEPIVKVKGPIIQAQLIETMILLTINHQSLITTKTNRIVRAAKGRPVIEFGSRRAQGADAAVVGARAAFIGGAVGTACTISEQLYGIPADGTMAHSWVQIFDCEYDSFKAYAETYPSQCTLLVDTYNVLKSGLPNAIRTFDEVLKPLGYRPQGIRIDSGDIAYLSKKARIMLDDAGYEDCKIIASNSLDEEIIRDLILQDAKIDTFGVGERLITAKSEPVFGGVYKLVAIEKNNKIIPKIKVSANVEKITIPGSKKVYRLYNRANDKAIADLITLNNETIDDTKPYILFNPVHTWKRKKIENFYAKELLVKIFDKGKLIYKSPDVNDIKSYCENEVNRLWDEILRFENPHKYFVDLSYDLWIMKQSLLNEHSDNQLKTIE